MALGGVVPGPGQGAVGAAALVAGGQVRHRQPHQRMPEPDAGRVIDADEPGVLGGGQVLEAAPPGRRARQDSQVAGAVQRGEQQQVAGGRGQRGQSGGQRGPQPAGEREPLGQGLGTRALGVIQRDRELLQRQRVALRLGHHAPPHPRRQLGEPPDQQFLGRRIAERVHVVDGKAAAVKRTFRFRPGRAQQARAGAVEPARHQAEDDGAGRVKPLHVIDGQQHGPAPRKPPDQRQHVPGDCLVSGGLAGGVPQRNSQRPSRVHGRLMPGHHSHQLPQPAVAEPRPVLHPGGRQDPHAAGLGQATGGRQQRGLARTRLPHQQQRTPGPRDARSERPDLVQVGHPADQRALVIERPRGGPVGGGERHVLDRIRHDLFLLGPGNRLL